MHRVRRWSHRPRWQVVPDYVRYVAPTHEVWVTEPREHRIEIFSLDQKLTPTHAAFIDISGGPESLLVDRATGRAYANL